jgi:cytochrome c553
MMNRLFLAALAVGAVGLAGGATSSAWAAGDAAAGKANATNCAMCHGENGEGGQRGPKLAGEAPAKFIQAMNDYKAGKGDSPIMKNLASQASDTDIANWAAYFASLK